MDLNTKLLSEIPAWRRTSDLSVRKGGEHGLQPQLTYPEALLRVLDLVSTAIFAIEGVLAAGFERDHKMDLLGCIITGTTVAVGGGTLRDLMLTAGAAKGAPRPFWIDEPQYIRVCVMTSAVTFFGWPFLSSHFGFSSNSTWLVAADAVALGVFAVIGTINGVTANIDPYLCILSGVMTATFGGVVRDILCEQPVRIMHSDQELYATCAMIGSATYMISKAFGISSAWRTTFGIIMNCLMRWAALTWDLTLPVHYSVPME